MSLLRTITSKYIESTLYDETKRHYEKSVLSVFNIGKKKKKTRKRQNRNLYGEIKQHTKKHF